MKKIYLLFLVLCLIVGHNGLNAQAVLPADSLALVAFYTASGGDWDNTNTWLQDSVYKWAGVTVTGNRVTELSIEGFFPSGTIAPELGNLSELKVLKLNGLEDGPVIIDLHGSIPSEIWNLTNLERLQIKFTSVTGGIPAGISSMTSLQEINFQQSRLGGSIPAELFQLPSLVKAYLHESDFTGTVPTSVTGATQLTRLYLFGNKLEGPLPFVNIKNLSANIKLTGNYFSFSDVKQYHDSAANYNLSDDYQFAKAIVVDTVDLGTEYIMDGTVTDAESYAWFKDDGTVPISTLVADTVKSFSLNDEGIYVCKAQSSTVSSFDIRTVYDLSLDDFIRDSVALVEFYNTAGGDWDTSGTWLVNPLSEWMGITVTGGRVTEINTSGLNPTGTISPSIGKLSALTVLKLIGDDNLADPTVELHGTIPAEIWNLTNLLKLQIKFTKVTGGIPAGISSMTSLQEINFQQTKLGGSIPAELFELPSLTHAYLHESDFTGTLPSTVVGKKQLARLYIQDNKLEGPLPFVDSLLSGKVQLTGNFFSFADVKPYHDAAAAGHYASFTDDFQYAQEDQHFNLNQNDSVAFELYVKDADAYAWFYNDNVTPISTDTLYYISSVVLSDKGTYVCKVQSSLVSNFEIRSIFMIDTIIASPAPKIQSAGSSTDGTTVSLTFDLNMADPSGEAANFTFKEGETVIAVTSVAVDGSAPKVVVLTLQTAISSSTAALEVSYTPGSLQSTEGGLVEAFGPYAVTNNFATSLNNTTISDIRVYPNPFSDYININGSSELKTVKILDITGKLVYIKDNLTDTNFSLPLQDLRKGIYFIVLETIDSTFVEKISKK